MTLQSLTILTCALAGPWSASAVTVRTQESETRQGDESAEEWDILKVAESEARRATAAVRNEISDILSRMALPDGARPEGAIATGYARLVEIGPNAVPVLEESVSTRALAEQSAAATHAATALVVLYKSTNNSAILDKLQALANGESTAIQHSVLLGLTHLDHPRAVATAQPFLESELPMLAHAAVTVLSAQTSATARGFLRPLLRSRPQDAALVIAALLRLESGEDHEEIAEVLMETEAVPIALAAIRYLGEYGEVSSLAALQRVLTSTEEWTQALTELQLRRCVLAVRDIGLRGTPGAFSKARQIIEELWLRPHPSKVVQTTARWELGPFRHEKAFESYEKAFESWSKAERQRNPKPWVDFAEVQAQFQKWDDALNSLKRVEVYDPPGEYKRDVVEIRCRAYCGREQYARAETALQSMEGGDFSDLPKRYREVRKMAAMEKYAHLFEKPE